MMFKTINDYKVTVRYYKKAKLSKQFAYRDVLSHVCKGDMIYTALDNNDRNKVDSAIPMQLWDKINTGHHVYSYINYDHGELLNIYKLFKAKIKVLINQVY